MYGLFFPMYHSITVRFYLTTFELSKHVIRDRGFLTNTNVDSSSFSLRFRISGYWRVYQFCWSWLDASQGYTGTTETKKVRPTGGLNTKFTFIQVEQQS